MSQIGIARPRQSTALVRLGLFVCLAVIEMAATSLLFVLDKPLAELQTVQHFVRQFVLFAVAALAAFAIISLPQWRSVVETWTAPITPGSWRVPLAVNLALAVVLLVATVAFSRHITTVDQPPWAAYFGYLSLLGATGLSLAWVAAPVKAWLMIAAKYPGTIALSAAAGGATLFATRLAQLAWYDLSGITLRLSSAILALYEADVRVDYDSRSLGVGNFTVLIDAGCSGYEGVGLVIVFLTLYLWVFRETLRFPRAFLLLPIGVSIIWLLNAVRIVILTSLGAHVSPEIAIGGFHSQAGWIAFLIVAIGIMALAPRFGFFRERGGADAGVDFGFERPASDRLMIAYLAPFMSLMAASIVMAATAPYDTWLYPLKVVAVGACLWVFRDVYRILVARVDPLALAAGILVGVAWIATAPTAGEASGVGAWIAAQPIWLAVLWLVFRSIGAIVMIPIAEELAFRGLLHRWLISRNFETVSFGTFSWLAFIVSSVLFGFMHQRVIEGVLAGAVFALVMYRSGRLSDPIAAHMAANAVIVLWAIAARDWALL